MSKGDKRRPEDQKKIDAYWHKIFKNAKDKTNNKQDNR